jgi:hypothetical protein
MLHSMNKRPHSSQTPDTRGYCTRPRPLIPRALGFRASLALAVAAAAAVMAPSAWAASGTTFCVHQSSSGCPAGSTDEGSDLQAALDAAAAQAATPASPNTVAIGSGTYIAPPHGFLYGSDNALRVTGAGDATTLTTGPNTYSVLSIGNAGRTISLSGLNIVVTSANGTGLTLTGGTADHVTITTTQPQDTGVVVGDSTLAVSSVNGTADATTGVSATRAELDDDTVKSGLYGIRAIGFTTIHRTTIDAQWGVSDVAGPVYIDDSLVKAGLVGLVAQDNLDEGSINALNDTLIGSTGIGVQASSTTTNGAEVQIVNSIVSGFPTAFETQSQRGGAAAIVAGTDAYDGSIEGSGVASSALVSVAPGFVNPAGGDYHLAAGSPLIDASATTDLGSLSSKTDLDGNPRAVTIDHPATPVDLGAYEYQPPAAGGNPGGGTPGTGGGTPGTGGGTPGTGGGTPGTGGNAGPGTGTGPNPGSGTPGTGTPSSGSRPSSPTHRTLTVKLTPLGHVTVTGRRLSLRLSCTGTAACSPVKLTATAMRRHHRVTVGSLRTRLSPGHKATLTLALNRTGRALLASTGRLIVTVTVTVRNGSRTLTVQTAHVKLT